MSLDVLFFFQAEDGIRDADVTGVQTCALRSVKEEDHDIEADSSTLDLPPAPKKQVSANTPRPVDRRSEERRVGKQWRFGGSRGHEMKEKRYRRVVGRLRGEEAAARGF